MGTHAETFRHPFATSATILAGIRRRDRFCSLASICCFESEDGQKLVPACVIDRFVETRLLACPIGQIAAVAIGFRLGAGAKILRLDGFKIDGVVLRTRESAVL